MDNVTQEDELFKREQALEVLRNSYAMYERSKVDMKRGRKNKLDKDGNRVYSDKSIEDTMKLMETMQNDVIEQYKQLGGDVNELKKTTVSKAANKKSEILKALKRAEEEDLRKSELDKIKNELSERFKKEKPTEVEENTKEEELSEKPVEMPKMFAEEASDTNVEDMKKVEQVVFERVAKTATATADIQTEVTATEEEMHIDVDPKKMQTIANKIKYDVIPLPSKGECYPSKLNRVPVAYLTAYDENMIVSPNLYKEGTLIDHLLESKILSNELTAGTMLPGDRDAVILWLRASGYGNMFPVLATDNVTGKQFESEIDLTTIKFKPFKLKGDKNGYFSFTLPVTKDEVKFKFLTYSEILELDRREKAENSDARKTSLTNMIMSIEEILEVDQDIDSQMRVRMNSAISALRDYGQTVSDSNSFTHQVTNRLRRSIVSVNGITDEKYLDEYVEYMNVRDSSALRKYIIENEPGLDFNVKVPRPESLGGGSIEMFLTLDQYLFLTVSE